MRTISGDSAQVHLLLGETRYARGDAVGALAELAKVETSTTSTLLVHRYAGLLYLHLNKRDEAIREFE